MRAAHAKLDLLSRSMRKTRSSMASSTATHTWVCWARPPWWNSTSSWTGPARISTIRSWRADVRSERTRSERFVMRAASRKHTPEEIRDREQLPAAVFQYVNHGAGNCSLSLNYYHWSVLSDEAAS